MRNKYEILLVGLLLAVLLVGNVSAELTQHQKQTLDKIDDVFSKIKYGIEHGFFLFTSWGQENGCSEFPDWEGWIEGNINNNPETVSCSDVQNVFNSNKCAIDIWYDNTIYIPPAIGPPSNVNWNNWLMEIHGVGVTFSDNDRPYYYVQLYACPTIAPDPDDHETDAYVCESGDWDHKGQYDINDFCSWDTSGEDRCWCADEDDNFYVDYSGGVHCRGSPRSEWCDDYSTHDYRQCVVYGSTESLYWYDSNGIRTDLIETCEQNEICTLNGCIIDDDAPEPQVLDGIIYDISVNSEVQPGDNVVVDFKVKNQGDSGNYLVEAGLIPKSVADDWGFDYENSSNNGFGIFDWLTQQSTECCPGQTNIFAKTIYGFSTNEIDEISLDISAPYSGIADLCYDNNYWDGEGEYVLYITMKTGCFPDGEDVTYETRLVNITSDAQSSGDLPSTQIGISKDDIETKTYQGLLDSLCVDTDNCLEGSCIPQQYLIDRGYLSEDKSESVLNQFCAEGDFVTLINAYANWLGLPFANDVCGFFTDDKEAWLNNYGYCVTDMDEDTGLQSFIRGIGKAVPITGDPLTDGYIVSMAAIIILLIVALRARRIDYVKK